MRHPRAVIAGAVALVLLITATVYLMLAAVLSAEAT